MSGKLPPKNLKSKSLKHEKQVRTIGKMIVVKSDAIEILPKILGAALASLCWGINPSAVPLSNAWATGGLGSSVGARTSLKERIWGHPLGEKLKFAHQVGKFLFRCYVSD